MYHFQHLMGLLYKWLASSREVLTATFRLTSAALKTEMDHLSTVPVRVLDFEAHCVDYDIMQRAVSVHCPLTRFLAGIYLELSRSSISLDSPDLRPHMLRSCLQMENSLRLILLGAQCLAGSWRKNGLMLLQQLITVRSPQYRPIMADMDLLAVQVAGATTEPNEFLIHLLHKFRLVQWFLYASAFLLHLSHS
jgi:hypothetical protein